MKKHFTGKTEYKPAAAIEQALIKAPKVRFYRIDKTEYNSPSHCAPLERVQKPVVATVRSQPQPVYV